MPRVLDAVGQKGKAFGVPGMREREQGLGGKDIQQK